MVTTNKWTATTAVKVEEGCSRRRPSAVVESMPLVTGPTLSRTVWWLVVHKSPHVKRSHAQASSCRESTSHTPFKSCGDRRVATGAG